MTLLQLQYAIAVAKFGSFTEASRQCNVTQPTLSMQVQNLEDELGVILFNRQKKPIELTEIGSQIINQANNIDNEVSRVDDIISQSKGFIGGVFKLGIIPTVSASFLSIFIKDFLKQYPKISLRVEELQTHVLIKKIKDGILDAGIAATPLHDPYILEKPLYREPFLAFCKPTHQLLKKKKLEIEDIKRKDLIVLEEGHCFRDQVLSICKQDSPFSYPLQFNVKSGSFETLIKLVKNGVGLTLLPYLSTIDMRAQDRELIRPFVSPSPMREVGLIYHKSFLKKQVLDVIESLVVEKIEQINMAQDDGYIVELSRN